MTTLCIRLLMFLGFVISAETIFSRHELRAAEQKSFEEEEIFIVPQISPPRLPEALRAWEAETQGVTKKEATAPVAKRPRSATENCVGRREFDICVSSAKAGKHDRRHGAHAVQDSDPRTAWIGGSSDEPTGEWVVYGLEATQPIGEVRIVNGFARSSDEFKQYSRVRKAELQFSGGEVLTFELADHAKEQIVKFNRQITGQWIQLRVLSVYPGSRYRNIAVAHVEPVEYI